MSMLRSIFRHIDSVYDLDLDVDVRDFLINRDTCVRLGEDTEHSKVLVKQGGDGKGVELGIYIGDEELERLGDLDLSAAVSGEAFAALVTAIEEISHFAYLLYSTSRARAVTQLELELQGEVDKFVTSTLLLASRNQGRVPSDLLDRLFGGFEVRRDLDRHRRERYEAASALASRYCSYVVEASLAEERFGALLPELRSFYRLTQRGKIGRIHNIVYTA